MKNAFAVRSTRLLNPICFSHSERSLIFVAVDFTVRSFISAIRRPVRIVNVAHAHRQMNTIYTSNNLMWSLRTRVQNEISVSFLITEL